MPVNEKRIFCRPLFCFTGVLKKCTEKLWRPLTRSYTNAEAAQTHAAFAVAHTDSASLATAAQHKVLFARLRLQILFSRIVTFPSDCTVYTLCSAITAVLSVKVFQLEILAMRLTCEYYIFVYLQSQKSLLNRCISGFLSGVLRIRFDTR